MKKISAMTNSKIQPMPEKYDDFVSLVGSGDIKEVYIGQSKKRLFVSKKGELCVFNEKSKKYGSPFSLNQFKQITKIKFETNKHEKLAMLVDKYRRYALKADFTNQFIRSCQSLPNDLSILNDQIQSNPLLIGLDTLSDKIGKVVSLSRCEKSLNETPRTLSQIVHGRLSVTLPEKTMDNRISTVTFSPNGEEYEGRLTMGLKGSSKADVYKLINSESFIFTHTIDGL